MTEGFCLVHQ